ncbi:MAG: hypothetical protein ACOY6N_08350 [Pseudomonadota bacterium]|uniref:hypothetical protein n=1 Tax=Sulfuricystis thermophila TaxID=2496847 RepID=UPI0010368968|nr:hypothetical protein [Sulfuricystis thermophila]
MQTVVEPDERVSKELSMVIEAIANDPDYAAPVTLGAVRDRLRHTLAGEASAERVHGFGDEEMLSAEIEALIDEYGEDALATELVNVKASEALSTVIETLLDETDEDVVPTLGEVRRAMQEGLVARLVGAGMLEAEDEQVLDAEIEALIERLGEDEPAENVLRYE